MVAFSELAWRRFQSINCKYLLDNIERGSGVSLEYRISILPPDQHANGRMAGNSMVISMSMN